MKKTFLFLVALLGMTMTNAAQAAIDMNCMSGCENNGNTYNPCIAKCSTNSPADDYNTRPINNLPNNGDSWVPAPVSQPRGGSPFPPVYQPPQR